MLFTRCPDCGTTFRVTDDALTKAQGQVRCGRCASVFNAYAELRDPPSGAAPTQEAPQATVGKTAAPSPGPVEQRQAPQELAPSASQQPSPSTHRPAAPTPELPKATATTPVASRTAQPIGPSATAAPSPSAAPGAESAARPNGLEGSAGERVVLTVADVVAQVGLVADEDAETGEMAANSEALAQADAMSAEEVDSVLDGVAEHAPQAAPWPLTARRRLSSRWWSAAAALASVALGAQAIHHFRADLVHFAVIGPIVKNTYAMFGTRVLPRFDVHQYQILDWVANAEPNTRGQGRLKITARIQNRAQQSQPYPSVHVQLKDRWEAAVGSRVFAPNEYGEQTKDLMAPGETARAEIEVVDPGPEAYGFELDVCIEVETDVISCGADKVFL